MNQMRWYVCEMIVVVSLCCLSKIVVSRVFSWPSFLSSKAFCSLLEDHWSMFVIWHLDIFMESHFWLFMIVAKTLPSWRKLMVHLGDKRFSLVRTDCIENQACKKRLKVLGISQKCRNEANGRFLRNNLKAGISMCPPEGFIHVEFHYPNTFLGAGNTFPYFVD